MRHEHVEELRREGYALVRELGRGGFATVYLAEHVRLHRLVAVKVLTVDVLDARVSPGGLPFIAMRLYQGGSLGHHLQRYGPLDPVQALNVGRRAAEALAAGHSIGIIHRDVKPENFLLDERREPYLADFGIAVLLHPELTATTSVAFTRQHAAPEVLLDNASRSTGGASGQRLRSLVGCVLTGLDAARDPERATAVRGGHRWPTDDDGAARASPDHSAVRPSARSPGGHTPRT